MSAGVSMTCRRSLRLRADVEQVVDAGGRRWLEASAARLELGADSAPLRAVVGLLADRDCTAAALRAAADGGDWLPELLDQLTTGGWLVVAVSSDDRPWYTLQPVRHGEPVRPLPADADVVLSRFAIVRRDDDGFVVESPRSWCEVRVEDPAVLAALGVLGRPVGPAALEAVLPEDVARRLAADLWAGSLVVPVGDAEETELRLRQWSPFELWMHSRSRLGATGRFNASWGATGWAEGRFDPLPARHDGFDGPAVELHRPDLDAVRARDPSLTEVLEARRSVREHDPDQPLTVAQLGEFLYRCARVRGVEVLDGVEHVDRPFPSGGALHEIELYPVVRQVAGLEPGLYHYDGHAHRLRLVSGDTPAVRRLIETAQQATFAESPQVVITMAARFGRLMWKYEAMGYAAILKNVGALYQVMYSVATAMGLAACGIGGGDAATFNEATGLDYFAESVVGEFLLGSPVRTEDDPALRIR